MRSRGARLTVVYIAVTALVLTLLGRLWYVQVAAGPGYAKAAEETRIRHITLPPVRGRVLDAEGRPLVTNRVQPVVVADYLALAAQPDHGDAVLARLAKLLDRPKKDLAQRVVLCGHDTGPSCWAGSPYEPIPLAEGLEDRLALRVMEMPEDFPGLSTELRPVRDYPYDGAAAQILGYVQPGQGGKDGLEAAYDADLAGSQGTREVAVDSAGRITQVSGEEPATAGADLVTSLDARIQRTAEDAVRRAVATARGDSGAAVVMEARTGRIVALASNPGYDPGVWTGGISQADYRSLLKGRGTPLLSRAIQGEYAPGSTWKITSAAAARFSPRQIYDCPGGYRVGDRVFHNFGSQNLGRMDMRQALIVSCDTIFYRLAYEMWLKDQGRKHARDPMQKMAKSFGFGARTGIDLPGESPGRVPDRTWKSTEWKLTRKESCRRAKTGYPGAKNAAYLKRLAADNCRSGGLWRAGDAANFSIGQGDVLVTPLQLARAYAALANGGKVFSPKVAAKLVRQDGSVIRRIKPKVVGRLPVPKRTLAYIRSALTEVPKSGTAGSAFQGFPFDKLAVAGKTGTSQAYGQTDTSWFASFAPAKKPKYVVVVVVSQGGTGASAAAPAARRIWEALYDLKRERKK